MKSQTVSPSRDSPSGLHTEFVSGKGRPASVQVSPPSEVTYTGALSGAEKRVVTQVFYVFPGAHSRLLHGVLCVVGVFEHIKRKALHIRSIKFIKL